MVTSAHTILYCHDAEAARAFLRDVLGFDSVDGGNGWLIFALPPSELACHPGAEAIDGQAEGRAELFLMCKDVAATRRDLEAKGAKFAAPVTDQGWGLITKLLVPGFGELGLYQPRHLSPLPDFA